MLKIRKSEYLGLCCLLTSFSTFANGRINLALNKPTKQSTTHGVGESALAVDGNTDPIYFNNHCSHTLDRWGGWWMVDLQSAFRIREIILYNRQDTCISCLRRLNNFIIKGGVLMNNGSISYEDWHTQKTPVGLQQSFYFNHMARYIKIDKKDGVALSLCEVEIYSTKLETTTVASTAITWYNSTSTIGMYSTSPATLTNEQNRTCDCLCAAITVDDQLIDQRLAELKINLKVNVSDLSRTRRKKTSAKDERTSATSFGVVGVFFISVAFGIVVFQDLLSPFYHFFGERSLK